MNDYELIFKEAYDKAIADGATDEEAQGIAADAVAVAKEEAEKATVPEVKEETMLTADMPAPAPVVEEKVPLTVDQKADLALGIAKFLASKFGALEEVKAIFPSAF